MHRRENIG